MAKRRKHLDHYISEYRKYSRGEALPSALQMRLSVKDRKALDEVAEHHGLNCSEIVRVLVFREARLAGLITETQIERGNNETRATGHLNA